MIKKDSHKKITILIASMFLLAAAFLSGCSFDEPTSFADKRAEVSKEMYQTQAATSEVNEGGLGYLARRYRLQGEGEMEVVVSYNPRSARNSAKTATENVSRISRILSRNGVKNVKTQILPVKDSEESMTYFRYVSYNAHAPSDCTVYNDIDDNEHENYDIRNLGCTTESYFAKQIARPKDLLGNGEPMSDPDGRVLGNATEWGYKWYEQNEALEGEQASEE